MLLKRSDKPKSKTSWLSTAKEDAFFRARATPAGRAVLKTVMALSAPLDYRERRRAAVSYNDRFPSDGMNGRTGYAHLPNGTLPGTPEIIGTCRRLFETKKAAFDTPPPTTPEALREQKKKKSFLKNMLDDDDLRANPQLVDFALSDALFSIVTNYLGVIPSLNRIDLLYSVSRYTDGLISSQLFHQDPEGVTQAKVFMNIFDVEEPNGPFTFIPASESERLVQAVRARRRAKGEPDKRRVLDREVEEERGFQSILRVTGPAGTALVVDTSRCLHLGSRVQHGSFRLCLFIQYCTSIEKANQFDVTRFKDDPVRFLALKRRAAEGSSSL